ncbi:ribosomal-protein-L7p-serine acetyltransferase [Bacillus sp. JCM 19046]|nr:ribosomal-protein-L7p-serine acetyltransferase [Bacillus sp. JCM 19045]GAF16982.1 ribosomal-protein-L7p-serine acetyltransferase [Bacillus sp. JCM 19046]
MFSFKVNDQIELELMQHHHKGELYDLIDSNRQHLRQWMLWVDKRNAVSDLDAVIPIWLHNYADNNGFDAGIRYNGKLVGMIALQKIDWKNSKTSLGYFLAQEAQGKGIITKAITALLPYIFQTLKLNRVEIHCAQSNTKSLAIPERLGFQKEGIQKEGQWLYDHYEDIVLYRLLAKDWKK